MIPDKRTGYESDEPVVGERLFSQLPFDDRWRLIKEAIPALHEPFSHQIPISVPISTMLSAVIGMALVHFRFVNEGSFWFWYTLQAVTAWGLLSLAERFDSKAKPLVAEAVKALGDLEESMLPKGTGGTSEPA